MSKTTLQQLEDCVMLAKSHVEQYTKKDGTFVAAHQDKRTKASPAHNLKAGDRVIDKWGDKGVIIGPDQKDPSRVIFQEDGAAYHSSVPAENFKLSRPKKKSKETDEHGKITLYHGTHDAKLGEIKDSGTFRGLFTHADSGSAHGPGGGDHLYQTEVERSKILKHGDGMHLSSAQWEIARAKVKGLLSHSEDVTDQEIDEIFDAAIDDRDPKGISDERLAEISGFDHDSHMISWQMQMIRGQVARALGYHAAEMHDEHGVSHLVLPGAKMQPVKEMRKAQKSKTLLYLRKLK